MSERDALLRAILEDPAEDTVRLVYADWLEENGEPERAAFIRDQVWLWAHPSCGSCTGPEWAVGKPCAECAARELIRGRVGVRLFGLGKWREFAGVAAAIVPTGARWDGHIHFWRGFVSRVELPCAAFLEHAAALFSAHPLTEVRLTDTEAIRVPPFADSGNDWIATGFNSVLDGEFWERIRGDVEWWHPSAEAVHAHLSDLCVAYGRALAKLPDLGPRKAVTT